MTIEPEEIRKILAMVNHTEQTIKLLELDDADLRSIIYYASGVIKYSRIINRPL